MTSYRERMKAGAYNAKPDTTTTGKKTSTRKTKAATKPRKQTGR